MRQLLALAALSAVGMTPGQILANHVCTNSPNEVHVGNSPAGNGVASVPICRWVERQPEPQPEVVKRWEMFDDRFGSWALDKAGPYGVAFGEISQEAAEEKALAMCRQRGGRECVVGGQVRNLCATYAWGGGMTALDGGETVELSERRALQACQAATGVKCDVIQTVCSLPVSRWVYSETPPPGFVPKQ